MSLGKKKFISQEYSTQNKGRNIKEGTRGSRGIAVATGVLFSIALIIGIGLIAFTVVFFYSTVDGPSMMYTLNASYLNSETYKQNTDSVIVNRKANPKRGDIIVVNHYDTKGKLVDMHIKRLIAFGGESIRFVDKGDHYDIEIRDQSGKIVSNGFFEGIQYHGNNEKNPHYNRFYAHQQDPNHIPPEWLEDDLDRKGAYSYTDPSTKKYVINPGNPEFRSSYEKDGKQIKFVQSMTFPDLPYPVNVYKLPDDYIFYMGDNRGGPNAMNTSHDDYRKMSIDCTYFGPQPASRIVGVVVEIVHNKSAPKWFASKIVDIITFKWIR